MLNKPNILADVRLGPAASPSIELRVSGTGAAKDLDTPVGNKFLEPTRSFAAQIADVAGSSVPALSSVEIGAANSGS